MPDSSESTDRREFLAGGARVVSALAFGSVAGFLAGRKGHAQETCWQLDPDKCIGCSNCATQCVLDESAVKCLQCFDMCGYCDICTGYFDVNYNALTTAAENQLCPTGAIIREFVEEKAGQRFYEYTIDEKTCIGCGKCVKGCALMNGSLYLQILHDRCVNCNECAIAQACPSQAFVRLPAQRPYLMKKLAQTLLENKSRDPAQTEARALINKVTRR
jgi:Na+-translocating ferredoxin:NAD+ oxidoreductase subunit B